MPPVEYGQRQKQNLRSIAGVSYDYDYPDGMDLTPGSDLHDKIVTEVLERAYESYQVVQNRFDAWNEIDRVTTAYVQLKQEDKDLKDQDPSKPVEIVFPYSYSMLETLLTYLFIAFAQEPIFRYEGVSPEDTIGAILMELVVQQHCHRNKVVLPLHTMFRDPLAYGFSVGVPGWERKYGKRIIRGEFETSSDIVGEIKRFERYNSEMQLLFEGNSLSNIDPYRFLPDPAVAIHEVQKGEYVGWTDSDNIMSLLRDEGEIDSELFNVKYLKHLGNKTSTFAEDSSMREERSGNTYEPGTTLKKNEVDIIHMYVDIIPEDFPEGDDVERIGSSDRPQKWKFSVAADSVLIEAHPIDYNHQMYPVVTMAPDFDGYTSTPISRLEILYGLQGVADFLFNSHMANVRKAINDMFIVDPQLVNVKDVSDPKPGKIIRLRKPMWGKGVKDVMMQFPVNDVTRGNIADSAFVAEWMERVMGTDPSTAGHLRRGGPERLTKSEFQGTRQGAVSRLERIARVVGVQGMQDLGYMFGVHTQQLMENETFVKIAGEWTDTLQKEFGGKEAVFRDRLKVTPYDLLVAYDTVVRDGSVPGGNFSEAWLQMFDKIAGDPDLRQQFDVFRIFSHIARSLGAKNVEQFKRQGGLQGMTNTTVMPDEKIANEANKGNLIPLG